MVYLAATQSLAALEILVHVDRELLAQAYVTFAVDIPSEVIETLAFDKLPAHWQGAYPPTTCQQIGQHWLDQQRTAALAVPSAIIPEEINYLLNPQHHDYRQIQIHPSMPFHFDARLRT